jgi:EAL domain-containing protein (putative c-di-GMP-specific phosphodiesterase class I)
MALRVISVRCGIWSLSEHSGLRQAIRPADLWVHGLDQQVRLRITLAEELRDGIERGELELFYQPQVEIKSGRILGLEALVRWNHPKRGLLMPSTFIPIAEKFAIIQQLGIWVFDAACRQHAQWEEQGIAPRTVAVNVSGIQLKRIDDFERDIAESLARWSIKSDAIELELTETVLMEASQKHSDALQRLRQMGLHIAIDDFGTGFSSLKYLTIYPVNRLKIAQELVFGVTDDLRNGTVVKAAIRLAHELGIEAIAEGVETKAQARFLLSAGCNHAQGYLYSRPVNASAATALLLQGRIGSAEKLIEIKDLPAA